jgi:cytoskeletal protein CcmA (bactofilin family)/DNA-directed RNA polymerase subunit RPC12/RpoP
MAAISLDKVPVACPHCGHRQPEAPTAFSTNCRKCGGHFRVQEALNPLAKPQERGLAQRRVQCFECRTELDVPASAESTMCKRCGRYVDMHSYRITNAIAKNFRTKGGLLIEPKGAVYNSETIAADVVIKGQFHGKLTAEHSLTIYTGADIKGSLTIARLLIPAENVFHWRHWLNVGSAEIAGELAANLRAAGTITLKSTARMLGDLEASSLAIVEGAVVVGMMRIGLKIQNQQPALLSLDTR